MSFKTENNFYNSRDLITGGFLRYGAAFGALLLISCSGSPGKENFTVSLEVDQKTVLEKTAEDTGGSNNLGALQAENYELLKTFGAACHFARFIATRDSAKRDTVGVADGIAESVSSETKTPTGDGVTTLLESVVTSKIVEVIMPEHTTILCSATLPKPGSKTDYDIGGCTLGGGGSQPQYLIMLRDYLKARYDFSSEAKLVQVSGSRTEDSRGKWVGSSEETILVKNDLLTCSEKIQGLSPK